MMGILSQYIHISNHHLAHFEHIIILLVNYTSIKFKKKKKIDKRFIELGN